MPHPAVERAKEMDREWFEGHPGRTIGYGMHYPTSSTNRFRKRNQALAGA